MTGPLEPEPVNPPTKGVPSSSYYTDESRRFMEELLKLEPGTQNGGIYANKPGYHNTRAQNSSNDYSVRDAEDKQGPIDKAAAYDWTFPSAQSGDYDRIKLYCDRLEAAWANRDPRVAGWREALGQSDYDGYAEGYDFRYHTQRTPDSSHLWHIHFSEDRGQVTSWDNKAAMLSVLSGQSGTDWEEGDVGASERVDHILETGERPEGNQTADGGKAINWLVRVLGDAAGPGETGDTRSLHAKADALLAKPPVDPVELANALAGNEEFIDTLSTALAGKIQTGQTFTVELSGQAQPATPPPS